MDVLVVGAGIGGLTTALALARSGHRVTLSERTDAFGAVGAGLVLAPNAVRVLDALGVDLVGRGQVLTGTRICSADGRTLSMLDAGRLQGRYGPTYGLPRAALHAALAAAMPVGVEVRLGRAVADVVPGTTGVRADGVTYDLVVGADGRRSVVREAVCGLQPERYSGTTCWRGFLDLDLGAVAIEAWGGRARVGAVPVGDGRTYYYLVLDAPTGAAAPAWPDGFARAFDGFAGTAGDVVRAVLAAGPPPLHHDLIELDRPAWGAGRVLLLGDAAHAVTPNQGQGAAMAIEDAAALALAVADGADGALARYATARAARVREVQLTSRRIGAVAHWRSPSAITLRAAAMRATPASAGARTLARLVRPGVELAARLA